MARARTPEPQPANPVPHRRWTWLVLALTILMIVIVRVRLREMPLERDEGEYAYMGQLMLQGEPPYKLAYNMKLPGTHAAYAVIMAVFGQSAAGIHLGFLIVNVASVLMVFLLGRRILDDVAGAAAAVTFGLLSTSPSFLGTAAHATHFVMLAALGGCLCLLTACARGGSGRFFASGLCFGLAFLMKQPGLFFGVFAFVYVAWQNARQNRLVSGKALGELGALSAGMLLPFAVTCLWLWQAGVFERFLFWTFSYGRAYASVVPWAALRDMLHQAGGLVFGLNILFWLLGAVGAVVMWWEDRMKDHRLFLLGLLLASLPALGTGLYFRAHYFVLLLPVLGLLCGVAVSRGLYLVRHEQSVELFLAFVMVGGFGLAVLVALAVHGQTWFAQTPLEASKTLYSTTLFHETVGVGEFLRKECPQDARIAVLGSEPQIYFHAHRRSATGYIYTYPLMERQRFASQMQEEMIREIEETRPAYVVYVNDDFSWLRRPASNPKIFSWWEGYWSSNYDLVKMVNVTVNERALAQALPSASGRPTGAKRYLMILKRRDSGAPKN